MDRRHQVFISSTYSDLKAERSELIQALLELDCIPAGMELFPATTEAAWELIKGVIEDSDYYCLVIGGRYGTTDDDGVSFTEREYDYAISRSKPLMAFIHKEPGQITADKTEKTEIGREKLLAFRTKVESAHHCKYWTTPSELGGLASRSLVNLRKAHPSDGWVRGKFAATDELLLEVANLRARVAELTVESSQLSKDASLEPMDTYASGSDIYTPSISYVEVGQKEHSTKTVTVTWDGILGYVGPALLNECTDQELEQKLNLCFFHALRDDPSINVEYSSIVIPYVILDEIKVQLRALGQMIPGTKKRAVADTNTYWKLTDRGEKRLISVQAIPKKIPAIEPAATATESKPLA